MGRFRDLTGKQFGRLLVIRRSPNRGNKTRWQCRCECGGILVVVPYHLIGGNTKSCGCLQREAAARNGHNRANAETAKKTLYAKYRIAAERRGLSFDLSYEEFLFLVAQNCYYCGCSPSTIETHAVFPFVFNGIDRWNNSIGYAPHNSVTCCKTCNFLKVKLSGEVFIAHCMRIASHQKTMRLKQA